MIRELKNIWIVLLILGFLSGCQGTTNNEVENKKDENVVENESPSKVVELQFDGLLSSFVLGDSVSEFETTVKEFIKESNPNITKWNFDFSTVNYEQEGAYTYTVYFDESSIGIEMSVLRSEDVVVESYVCFNIETDEICEDGQGPEINVLHNDYFDESNEVFYIPHTFKTEMEYADYLISTHSFHASDQQDGDIDISYGFDLEENVFLLFAEDSDGNNTTWAIPAQVEVDSVISSGNNGGSNNTSNVDNVNSNHQSNINLEETEDKLPANVDPGSKKVVTTEKANELTNMFASEGNYKFEPATIYVKYITPDTFFTRSNMDSALMTRVTDSGTVLYNTRQEFAFDLNKVPVEEEDLNTNIPTVNVSYNNGILKFTRVLLNDEIESLTTDYTFDWNKGTMTAIHRYSQVGVYPEIIYAEYDAHTRITKMYQSIEEAAGCDSMSIYNHATGQYWLTSGNSATSSTNSIAFKPYNIMDNYLSYHSDELIMP